MYWCAPDPTSCHLLTWCICVTIKSPRTLRAIEVGERKGFRSQEGKESRMRSPGGAMEGSSAADSNGLKRRHASSSASTTTTAATSTPFKTPIKPSPTETLFRILCPADSTGGVIGKGGSIIRQFREETGAKIRIDDPVLGSDDRVILIVADSHPKKGEDEVSPAQMALIRVFERMLRVEEERMGEAEGGGTGGGGEVKEIQGLVVCKLLAQSSQVGCVLGKGGKIVEKIRQETGAQIRVFGKEQVPACAAAGDELIHVRKFRL